MNTYRIRFTAKCPIDGAVIRYALEIKTREMIRAEKLEEACADRDGSFHENMADFFHKKFGGRQVMRARHGKVSIETVRGTL